MSTDVNLSKDDRDCILDAILYWLESHPEYESDNGIYRCMRRLEKKFILLTPWRDV